MNIDDPNDSTTNEDDVGAFADGYEVDANADRGDAVVDDDAAQAEADAKAATEATKGKDADKEDEDGKEADKDAARDEKGRFAKKEAEEEDADDDEDEDEDEGDKGDKNYAIRIAKMRDQRDAERAEKARLQAEVEALRQQTAAKAKPEPQKSDVEVLDEQAAELYVKVEEARADGNIAEAAAMQRQLDAINRKIATIEATQVATTVTVEQRTNAQYDHMLGQLESVAPVLVPGTEDYDPKVVAELEFLVESFEAKGLSAPAALRKASTYLFGTDPWGSAPAKKVEEAAPPVKDKKPEAKKPDIKKAVEHTKKDPGDISKSGTNVDSSKINPLELDDEEFNAIPAATLARMRGDAFA